MVSVMVSGECDGEYALRVRGAGLISEKISSRGACDGV